MKTLKPTNNAQRNTVLIDYQQKLHSEVKKYPRNLFKKLPSHAGRNNQGTITTRHHGGGHKKKYPIIDFKRYLKDGVEGMVKGIKYSPYHTSFLCFISYRDGSNAFILAPEGLKIGDKILSGENENIPIQTGNNLPLKYIPAGTFIHNIELKPKKGGQLARSAGNYAVVRGSDENKKYIQIKLPSGEVRKILAECRATVGKTSNSENNLVRRGKAVDHPHGGGEGKASIGRKSPLKKKCEKANQAGKVITLKVYKRGTVISDKMVGHNFLIHNGKNFNSLQPTSEHIGYRFGEFAPTRRVGKHGKAAISPQKLRPVANLVRRKEIDYSLNTLHFLPHKGARILHKILQGAIKQIKKRDKKEKAVFYISQIRVDQGSIRKKMIFRAKGSANTLRQTTSHLFLCLSPKEATELFVFVYSPNISLITGEDNDNLDQILTKITNIVNEKKIITKLYLNEERKIYSSAQAIANDLALAGEKDIRGIKVRVGGCLEKGGIAQHKTISQGRMPSNTLDSLIKEAKTEANTIYGQIGIVVQIYKGKKKKLKYVNT
ncbi:1059_t:CDS:2 [Entrophospora sp. SA101]|nr:1059_t:CDS:2 [Entrophospora sp. SA101]